MCGASVLQELSRALGARGFAYAGMTPNGWPRFQGRLTAAGAAHAARVSVDLTGQELPRVYVDLPAGAPPVMAHVGANGFVCYAVKGSLVLDIFDIPGQSSLQRVPMRDPARGTRAHVGDLLDRSPDAATLLASLGA